MSEATSEQRAENALSVSEAMRCAKGALEDVVVRLVGEVSEFSHKPGYKAVYFTVKDESASLPCMIWNNRYEKSGVEMFVGQLVELTGRFTLYAAKGRMNFEVFGIAAAGEGNLRLQVANLARKLSAEGLMDAQRKIRIPSYPTTIGLVTSPRGDAVHDVLRTLRRRFPVARVVLAGVAVEGARAAEGIIEGLRCMYRAKADVILLVRGGGSFEDLMPFNDEALARAIAKCPIPVVTGIGHEPDNSIADMVSDLRCSTPTAAAEAVSPAREELLLSLAGSRRSLQVAIERSLESKRVRIQHVLSRPIMSDSNLLCAQQSLGLDLAAERLFSALPTSFDRTKETLRHQQDRLNRAIPNNVERDALHLDHVQERFIRALLLACVNQCDQVELLRHRFSRVLSAHGQTETRWVESSCSDLERIGVGLVDSFASDAKMYAARLHDLSPLAVLGRGYALAKDERGGVIKKIEDAPVGSSVEVTVSNGSLSCLVEQHEKKTLDVVEWEEG